MDLKARVERFDDCFGRLIDLIAPKFYFADQTELNEELELDKRSIFEEEAEVKSKKILHQKVKLDSDLNKNVSEIIDEKCGKNESKKKKKSTMKDATSDDPWGRKLKLKVSKNAVERSSKLTELKKKIKVKIINLKKERKAENASGKSNKRESKKERREKNRSNPGAKQKGFAKKALLDENATTKSPKLYNQEGKLIFSKFDMVAPPLMNANGNEKKKAKSKVKKLKMSLNQIKKEKEKMSELVSEGKVDEAINFKKNKQWRNAMLKSEGEKVKDNEKLIEKSLKRQKKLKERHTSKWNDRIETVNKKMEAKQEKRTKNLKQRQDKRKEAKIKRSKKKGRVVFND